MRFRSTRLVVLALGLSLATTACGRYSISNIRSLMAFKDGNTAYSKGDYASAVPLYEKAISMNPDLGFAYFFLGNSYDKEWKPAKKGQADNDALLPKAVENYQLATQRIVNMPDPQGIRRLAYEYLIAAYGSDKLNDFSKAEAASKELIAVEPDEPGNYQALARLYEDQGQYDEAEAMFKKSIDIKANDAVGYQLLAQYYNRQGQFDKMIDTLQQRADKEPNNPEAWHTMGTYYYEKAYRDKRLTNDVAKKYILAGIAAEDKALGLNPDYYDAVTYKSLLVALQANHEGDRGKINQLMQEADQLRAQARDLQKKQEKGK
jgi:tetratricopeptide (TPR) repeat protein